MLKREIVIRWQNWWRKRIRQYSRGLSCRIIDAEYYRLYARLVRAIDKLDKTERIRWCLGGEK